MKNNTLKNIYINTIVTIMISGVTLILNKYFSYYMGATTLGLMRLFTQLVACLSLVELGLGVASAFALYKPLVENDDYRVNVVLSTIESLYTKVAVGVAIVGFLLNFALPFVIKENIYGNYLYVYWTLYVMNISFSYLYAKYTILFTADKEYGFLRKSQGITRVCIQILQIIGIILTQSFLLYVVVMILENILLYIIYTKFYKKKYSKFVRVKERDNGIKKDIMNLFWHQIGSIVVYNTDYIIISKFLSLSMIGIYSSYIMVYQMVIMMVGIITPVLAPNIGHFIAQNTKEDVYKYWKKINSLYYFLGTGLVIVTYRLINKFIILWVGESYLLPSFTVFLLMINLFIQTTGGITGVFKSNSGFFDDIYSPIFESLINLLLSIYLVRIIGIDGVIIGTIASNVMIIFLLRYILVFRRCFGKGILEFGKHLFKYTVLIGVGIFLVKMVLDIIGLREVEPVINTSITVYQWLLEGIITTTITFLILLGVFILDKDFRSILKQIKIYKSIKI